MNEKTMHPFVPTTISRRLVLQGSMTASLAGLFVQHVGAREATPATAPSPVNSSGDFAGLVDVGADRDLSMECRGSGTPSVVLEAGYRSPATVWTDDLAQPAQPRTMVLPGVAAFTRVCAYDRPGTDVVLDGQLHKSRSTPLPMPARPKARSTISIRCSS